MVDHTQQVLSVHVLPPLGQPFVPSLQSRRGYACFLIFQPIFTTAKIIQLEQQQEIKFDH